MRGEKTSSCVAAKVLTVLRESGHVYGQRNVYYCDAFVSVVQVGAISPPGDCGLGVSPGGLALQHCRLSNGNHDVNGVLSEVVPQN